MDENTKNTSVSGATSTDASKAKAGSQGVSKGGATVTMGMMAIMLITTVLSLRGLASQSVYGFGSIFYYVFAALVFLIPYALVCAELASGWTKAGGIFRWVSEGLGTRWGLSAMFLEWLTIVIWFPSVLMFAAVALAYVFWPETFDDKLSSNRIYTIIIVLAFYWISNFNTFRGMKSANKLSTYGGLFGTIIPGIILIVLGIIYVVFRGHDVIQLPMDKPFFPDFSKIQNLVLAASIFLFYGGLEMQAVHVQSMNNPAKNFPKAIFLAVIAILAIFILATLAVGVVIPEKDVNLLASLLVAYNLLWKHIGLEWMGHIMALFIAFGVLGQVSVIIAGPSRGIYAVGKAGFLPKGLQKTNKNGIQVPILYMQAIIVTILSFALVVLPSVESAYQILSQMATIIYLLMVVLIYLAFIWLRHTQPNTKRGFTIPGGKFVAWFIFFLGILGATLAILLSFVPPDQITTGSPAVYVIILIVGAIVFFSIPLIIYASRKKTWKDPNSDFPPFNWEIEGRKPTEVSKVSYES